MSIPKCIFLLLVHKYGFFQVRFLFGSLKTPMCLQVKLILNFYWLILGIYTSSLPCASVAGVLSSLGSLSFMRISVAASRFVLLWSPQQ